MYHQQSNRKTLLFFIFSILIQDIFTTECGWAYRIERFLSEQDAMEGSWPWMVAIARLGVTGEFNHQCSGSMITNTHLLAAANCFALRRNPSLYKARIGHVQDGLAQEYNITQIVFHKNYIHGAYYDNIAILTLDREVDTENFNPICLPTSLNLLNSSEQITSLIGWGRTIPSMERYPNLREKFGFAVIPNSRCNEKLRQNMYKFNESFPDGVSDEMICTDTPNDCIVDTGSPLMYQDEDQWYIVGLVSFKMSCEKPGFPTAYTNVFKYLKWIEKNINLVCGKSPRNHESVKIGEAPQGSWPWMVAIARQDRRGNFSVLCSGSMITRRHVLSPAHCFDRKQPTLYQAKIGHIDERLGQEYNVSRIVLHEDYKRGNFYDDIAILTLKRNVDFENFNPICLPPSREFVNLTGQFTALAGWGLAEQYGTYPMLKEKFGFVVISNSRCNKKFSDKVIDFRRKFIKGITDTIICTTYPNECLESSGSPLMYLKEDRWYVVGVVTFGAGCDKPGTPTGYTRVSNYISWIQEKIKN